LPALLASVFYEEGRCSHGDSKRNRAHDKGSCYDLVDGFHNILRIQDVSKQQEKSSEEKEILEAT
jgi:hypothetical protein